MGIEYRLPAETWPPPPPHHPSDAELIDLWAAARDETAQREDPAMAVEPITDTELANVRDNLADADRSADPWEVVPNYRAVSGLLAEVDALRASLKESEARRKDLFRRLGEAHDDLGDATQEAARLRAENTAQAQRIAEVRELRRTWFQNADVVRGKADSIPGLTEVERAELRQGAVELEHCARQVGFALGPTPEEEPDFVAKDLDRRLRVDDADRSALGLDQDGEGNADPS